MHGMKNIQQDLMVYVVHGLLTFLQFNPKYPFDISLWTCTSSCSSRLNSTSHKVSSWYECSCARVRQDEHSHDRLHACCLSYPSGVVYAGRMPSVHRRWFSHVIVDSHPLLSFSLHILYNRLISIGFWGSHGMVNTTRLTVFWDVTLCVYACVWGWGLALAQRSITAAFTLPVHGHSTFPWSTDTCITDYNPSHPENGHL